MRLTPRLALLALPALLPGAPALAAPLGAAPLPFYAGASVGQASIDLDTGALANVDKDENDVGFKLFAGYKLNTYLGVEAGYVNLGEASVSALDTTTTPGTPRSLTASSETQGFALFGVGRMPAYGPLTLFYKLGGVFADREVERSFDSAALREDDEQIEFAAGVGTELQLGPRQAVRFEYEYYDLEDQVDLFSVGYQFGF